MFIQGVRTTDKAGDIKASLMMRASTIGDIKIKVEEKCGVPICSQILYRCVNMGNDDESLEDDLTIDECGICDNDALLLFVDPDKHYWQQHANLIREFKLPVIKVYKVMSACANDVRDTATPESRRRVTKFLRNCRKGLAVMLERPTSHKARPMDDIHRLKRHFTDVIMPIYHAVCSREQQHRAAAELAVGQ